MSKSFFKVADDFDGTLNVITGDRAGSYGAGDLIVMDSDSPESRALADLGDHALSNYQKGKDALTALVVSGDLTYGGILEDQVGIKDRKSVV